MNRDNGADGRTGMEAETGKALVAARLHEARARLATLTSGKVWQTPARLLRLRLTHLFLGFRRQRDWNASPQRRRSARGGTRAMPPSWAY